MIYLYTLDCPKCSLILLSLRQTINLRHYFNHIGIERKNRQEITQESGCLPSVHVHDNKYIHYLGVVLIYWYLIKTFTTK